MQQLFDLVGGGPTHDIRGLWSSLILAFILGMALAWIYAKTHSGMSYSRTFTQSLITITMVVTLVLFVIGESLVTAFGLLGALSLIRFRNVLKDTRDTGFVFIALVLGMAIGTVHHREALIGAACFAATSVFVTVTHFGTKGAFDGHLTCRLDSGPESRATLSRVLRRHCQNSRVITERQGGAAAEIVFQIELRDPARSDELVEELEALPLVESAFVVVGSELAEI